MAPYILNYGTEEQKKKWLPQLATGELIGAIAMSEPGTGSDLQGVKTRAQKSGNGYVLNGSKTFITNGQHANLIIVVAKTDPTAGAKGTSLMVVETDEAPGFRRGRQLKKIGMHSQDTSELFFDQVRVPASNILAAEGQGFALLMNELAQERLTQAVKAVAACEAALDWTIDYVTQRHAFGKPIAEFQLVQAMLADMQTECFAGRCMVEETARRRDGGAGIATEAACAKMYCSEMVGRVADKAVQIHGGAGYVADAGIERFYRDVRLFRIYEGTTQIQQLVIARNMIREAGGAKA